MSKNVIAKENAEMVLNNNKQISHHTKELATAVKGKKVPAWVVAKVNRSASDLSDATHYLEGTKYAKGSTIKTLKPIKVKAYGMEKSIVNLTQKAIDFLQKKFPQYRGEKELDSTEPYWDMVDAVRENFDTDTPTKYGEIGEEIVRMYLDKENKYAKGGYVFKGDKYEYVPAKFIYTIGGL